jgi:predicted  nucleic acid-binding Zn-ribbon protein
VDLKRFEQLQSQVSVLRRQQAKAEGALEETMRRLESNFGCKSLRKAEVLLEQLQKDAEEAREAYEQELARFETEYGELLEGVPSARVVK